MPEGVTIARGGDGGAGRCVVGAAGPLTPAGVAVISASRCRRVVACSPGMEHVTSSDGTRIAYERHGEGPPIIVVGGAMADHNGGTAVAEALADDFTVLTIDRRARGESEDNSPGIDGAVEREVADLAALIEAVGGRATLLGSSSGAVLSLAAAAHGLPVDRLAVFEPPFATEEFPPVAPPDMPDQLAALLAEGRDSDVAELF